MTLMVPWALIPGVVMRTMVFLSVLGGVSACGGGWELHDDVSPMDGEHNIRLIHDAVEKLQFGQNTLTPWMTLRLHPTFALEVHTIALPDYNVWSRRATIRYRLDDQPTEVGEAPIIDGPLGQSGLSFMAVPVKLFAAKTMLVEYKDRVSGMRTLTFNLSGLRRKVERACSDLRPTLDCTSKTKNIQVYLDAPVTQN
jgi:hypothetical protein